MPVKHRDASSLVEESGGHIALCELPAVPKMASTLHHGSPYRMIEALQALGTWMETNRYTISGPRRGICLRREGDLDDYLTELQFPVEKMS